jgi:hypothetical protein
MASTEARSKSSPGPASGDEVDLQARIAVLEERLAELEVGDRSEDPLERLLGGMLPSESRAHLRAARREQLLAARSFIDHWIERLDRKPMPKERRRRESISLE